MNDGAKKLAASRQAIIQYVHRKDHRYDKTEREVPSAPQDSAGLPNESSSHKQGLFDTITHAAATWWRHHPAHMAIELATPTLSRYARRKPVQFLGMAVVAGAVIVVARPWKLMSATGIVMALLKSSQLSGLVMSAMSAADYQKDEQRPYR